MKYVIMAILIAILTGCNCSTPVTTSPMTIKELGITTVQMLKGEKRQTYFEACKVLNLIAEIDAYHGSMSDLVQPVMQQEVSEERMEYNIPKLNATFLLTNALILRLDRHYDLDLLEWEDQVKLLKEYIEAMATEAMDIEPLTVEEIEEIKEE